MQSYSPGYNDCMEEGNSEGLQRSRSKVHIYVHFVWTTKYRANLLMPEYERRIHRCLVDGAQSLECRVLAIGGTANHVHLIVRMPGKLSPSALMKQIKAASTLLYNEIRPEFSDGFRWQDGYGCFSLWSTQVDKVIRYVHNQKQHHAAGTLYDIFEQSDEPAPNQEEHVDYEFPSD